MTYVLLGALILVGLWAISLAGRRTAADQRSAALTRELATMQERNVGLYRHSQAVEAELAGAQSRMAAAYHHTRGVESELATTQARNTALYNHSQALDEQLRRVAQENAQLAKYSHIVDVEREVLGMREQAGGVVAAANHQAASVVADAYTQAQAIAADALDAKRNTEAYRMEARALRNVIEGYGDRYIIPTESLLDELAESYGYTEAGVSLKAARQRTKQMIKAGQAASCDYVEPERRDAAIRFVIDAFVGKVDTVLAEAKAENFGTLRQQIIDAYALVNKNGRAFRDAKVLQAFCDARIDELRWACVAYELREKEREEQRRIKEQIREEEKARRDFERAQREVAKEEETIRKAMEIAQRQFAVAGDEQRAKYETQLQELAARLQEAEERGQRALSMAQQTKRGHVYIISNVGSFGEDVFKIGLTRRLEPLDRVRELGDASVPFEFDVHALIFSEDAPALEHSLHRLFIANQLNKVNPRKEFFRATLGKIREEVQNLGIDASWTMVASAAQYRESMAIERAIKDNPAAYQSWVNRQLVIESTIEEADEVGNAALVVSSIQAVAN